MCSVSPTLRIRSLVTLLVHLHSIACLSPNLKKPSNASLPHSLALFNSSSVRNASGCGVSATGPTLPNKFPYIIPFNEKHFPHALVSAKDLVPNPPELSPAGSTPADLNTSPPAQPGQMPKADQPLQTGGPRGPLAADPGTTPNLNNDAQNGHLGTGTGAQDPKNTHPLDPQGNNPEPPNQNNDPANTAGPSGEASNNDHMDLGGHLDPGGTAQRGNDGDTATPVNPSIGKIIMQGFGPNTAPDPNPPAANQGIQNNPDTGQPGAAVPLPAGQPLTIGDQTFTPAAAGFMAAGGPVNPGGPVATIAGTPISLATENTLVIGDTSYDLNPGAAMGDKAAALPAFTVGGQAFTPNAVGFTIAGPSVSPGGTGAIVSGTSISLNQAGVLTFGTQTIDLNSATAALPALTAGGQTFTPHLTGCTPASTAVSPNGPAVTISGTRISLGPSGQLVIGSSTTQLRLPISTAVSAVPELITIGSGTITPNPTGLVVDGKTVAPGGSGVVVDGTSVRLEEGGVLDVGGKVTTLASVGGGGGSSGIAADDGVGVGRNDSALVSGGSGTGQAYRGGAEGTTRYQGTSMLWALGVAMIGAVPWYAVMGF